MKEGGNVVIKRFTPPFVFMPTESSFEAVPTPSAFGHLAASGGVGTEHRHTFEQFNSTSETRSARPNTRGRRILALRFGRAWVASQICTCLCRHMHRFVECSETCLFHQRFATIQHPAQSPSHLEKTLHDACHWCPALADLGQFSSFSGHMSLLRLPLEKYASPSFTKSTSPLPSSFLSKSTKRWSGLLDFPTRHRSIPALLRAARLLPLPVRCHGSHLAAPSFRARSGRARPDNDPEPRRYLATARARLSASPLAHAPIELRRVDMAQAGEGGRGTTNGHGGVRTAAPSSITPAPVGGSCITACTTTRPSSCLPPIRPMRPHGYLATARARLSASPALTHQSSFIAQKWLAKEAEAQWQSGKDPIPKLCTGY
ncbi:hypothetical protein B0H12DRAFT_1238255 [Mycena haematopus]|nr:hypothetical protein B0H12DRAFT_1238255 [Mycena haematopus]